jgi:hypothetical protein
MSKAAAGFAARPHSDPADRSPAWYGHHACDRYAPPAQDDGRCPTATERDSGPRGGRQHLRCVGGGTIVGMSSALPTRRRFQLRVQRRCSQWMLLWSVVSFAGACQPKKQNAPPAQPVRAEDILGKWRLVRAGGQPPSDLNIRSLEMDFAGDGSLTSDIEMQGQFAGTRMQGGGKWSLVDGIISYTSGANSGKSAAQLNSGRLVLTPDLSVRKGGTIEVTGEYERDRAKRGS